MNIDDHKLVDLGIIGSASIRYPDEVFLLVELDALIIMDGHTEWGVRVHVVDYRDASRAIPVCIWNNAIILDADSVDSI